MEKYSFNQAEAEAELIRKKALEAKGKLGKSGEPENIDYSEAEKQVDSEPYFLREGREKWLEIVRDYWANYKANHKMEIEADRKIEKSPIDELIISFEKGIGRIHHRLESSLGCFHDTLEENKLFTTEQLNILQMIVDNSSRNGKINRYSTSENVKRAHPVHEIYSNFFDNQLQISKERFELLKEDAMTAGASTALSTSPEEFVSWFHWADDPQNSKSEKSIYMILNTVNMSTEKRTEEERELIRQARLPVILTSTRMDITQEEFDKALKTSKEAQMKWLKLYFSDKFVACPSFSDYIKGREILDDVKLSKEYQHANVEHGSEIADFDGKGLENFSPTENGAVATTYASGLAEMITGKPSPKISQSEISQFEEYINFLPSSLNRKMAHEINEPVASYFKELFKNARILDLGCGIKAAGYRIAEDAGSSEYIGVEKFFAKKAFEQIKLVREKNIPYKVVQEDMLPYLESNWQDKFNVIMLMGIDDNIIQSDKWSKLLSAIKNRLADQGMLVTSPRGLRDVPFQLIEKDFEIEVDFSELSKDSPQRETDLPIIWRKKLVKEEK